MNLTRKNSNCDPLDDPLDAASAPWQRRPVVQWTGAALAVLPVVGIAVWMNMIAGRAPSLTEMFGGPLIGGNNIC
jgi:hypothetical protein